MDLSLYPYGFLLGRAPRVPDHFVAASLDLHVHPLTKVETASRSRLIGKATRVVLIGTCVDVMAPDLREPDIAQRLVAALASSEDAFHRYGDQLCGRYAIVFERRGSRKIVTDATGLRTVFYAADGSVVGSHAKLVHDQIATPAVKKSPYRGGHPGRMTPYPGVFLLTPNTTVEMGTAAISRFFPREPLEPAQPREVADQIAPLARVALEAFSRRTPLVFSITAGLDSRTSLAAAPHIAAQSEAFTYGNEGWDVHRPSLDIDTAVAPLIAAHLGCRHQMFPKEPPPEDIEKAIDENTYLAGYSSLVAAYLAVYGQRRVAHVKSNLLEIGRAYFKKYRIDFSTPEGAAEFVAKKGKGDAAKALTGFQDLYRVTDFDRAVSLGYDPMDVLYWEHRMGARVGPLILSTDIVFDTLIPWNSRLILNALLRPPLSHRRKGSVARILVRRAGLDLWPINAEDQATKAA